MVLTITGEFGNKMEYILNNETGINQTIIWLTEDQNQYLMINTNALMIVIIFNVYHPFICYKFLHNKKTILKKISFRITFKSI